MAESSYTNKPDVSEIVAFAARQEGKALYKPIVNRQKEEFLLFYCLEQPEISATEGKWEHEVVNSPLVFCNKLIEEQASGKLKFIIPISSETEAAQDRLTMTERAVCGLLAMADDALVAKPFGVPAQAQAAHDTNIKGILIPRLLMFEDEDGKVQIALDFWDLADTYWVVGREGIQRLCHISYAQPDEIEEEYGKDFVGYADKVTLTKGIKVIDYWTKEWEQVVVGNEVVNNEGKGNHHNLGRIPVGIFAAGSMGLPSDSNLIQYAAPSCWAMSKNIWLARTKMLSYRMTNAKVQVNRAQKAFFDSTKGGRPIDFGKLGDAAVGGKFTPLDIGKGQDIQPMEVVEMTREGDLLEAELKKLSEDGSAPPILYGVSPGDITAQGTGMLIRAARASLQRGTRNIEQMFTWFANEVVRQCKDKKWTDVQIQGIDGKNNQFATTLKAEELVTDRKIEARLNLDTFEDQMVNLGKAVEAKVNELADDEFIWDTYMHVDDPKAMGERLRMQRITKLTGLDLRAAQKIFIEKGDELAAAELQKLLLEVQERLLALIAPPPTALPEPGGNGGGVPGAAIPGAMPGKVMAPNMPTNRMRQGRRAIQGR